MLDFLIISKQSTKRGVTEIYPRFKICKSKDLMIRGNKFYAIWDESKGLWSTSMDDAINLIDAEIAQYAEKEASRSDDYINVQYLWDANNGSFDKWKKYCEKQQWDNYHPLDCKLTFANQPTKKEDYVSKKLPYSLEPGDISAWKELTQVLYAPEELHKIEWCIGAIVNGDSTSLQKFLVLYGPPGSGKSTIIEVIQKLFTGYYCVFNSKALGNANESFALEPFAAGPLVAIEHDGDLSKIEDNTKLNSLVSHEVMNVNEKHKNLYSMKFLAFPIMGTNKFVKITDYKSGLTRRLIDARPTGNKVSINKYMELMDAIDFELGAIACHCKEVYESNKLYYKDYVPKLMMSESNDFYNFIIDTFGMFKKEDGITLKQAWELYKVYCDDAKMTYSMNRRVFKSELLNYFRKYDERLYINGEWLRSYYSDFKTEILETGELVNEISESKPEKPRYLIDFKEQHSILDDYCADCAAQYANSKELPKQKWDDVTTKLKDLDTHECHYLKVPENLIVIDFDIKDENGNKSFEKNLIEASKFPPTYAELSKSGGGIHLHYIYNGDLSKLSRIYADNIEIKIYTGKSSLRRKLSKCNDLPIATITSGLPMKGETKVINFEVIKNEKALRTMIRKNLNKEYHSATKPSMDFIFKILEDAYASGMNYDVSDLKGLIIQFAASSTNQSEYCLSLIPKMKFKSDEPSTGNDGFEQPIVFYDCEVYPNLFIIRWKLLGSGKIYGLINPKPYEVESLMKYRLVGYNCRKYDNHIIYAAMLGYSNEKLYKLSQSIIKNKEGFFSEAYNLSYTDIYDYAATKQTLKKWEIQLGIHHKEMGLSWDEPVPEEKWQEVYDYCENDVIATEAVWNVTQPDFTARMILAEIAGMTVNDTTNTLTTKIIFGNEKHPQLKYTELEKEFPGYEFEKVYDKDTCKYIKHNWYRGMDMGLGGLVISNPGMYGNVALLDVASLHPHSAVAMNVFGDYTKNFVALMDARIFIKHKEYDKAKQLFNGKLSKYLDDPTTAKQLSQALKIAINSVYGLTSAAFDNPFKDPRNENNIVALRGALFMKTLYDEVVARGFKVAHIKTDSIKIPDATPEIIQFCYDFAQQYGYTFEHEATYDRICLVNDAVYIAKYATVEDCIRLYGKDYVESSPEVCKENKEHDGKCRWTATGTQFQVPYVFKKCFTHEDIEFRDLCETKEVKSAIYLDMDENLPEGEHNYHFVGKVGLFCPVKAGVGGGRLLREQLKKDGTIGMDAVTGTKGYRWLEAEYLKEFGEAAVKESIDYSYHDNLVTTAINTISNWGDYEWFVSDDRYDPPVFMNGAPVYDVEVPF